MGTRRRTRDCRCSRRHNLTLISNTIDFHTIQIHHNSSTAVHVQLIAVHTLQRINNHSSTEQPYRVRYTNSRGQFTPRRRKVNAIPASRHCTISQVCPCTHLTIQQILVRERSSRTIGHSRILSNKEGSATVTVGGQGHRRSLCPLADSMISMEYQLIHIFRKTEDIGLRSGGSIIISEVPKDIIHMDTLHDFSIPDDIVSLRSTTMSLHSCNLNTTIS